MMPSVLQGRKREMTWLLLLAALWCLWHFYYDVAVYYKGSVNPLYVWRWTAPGLPHSLELPPADWRPRSRVVMSMTTMPDDIHNIHEVLVSLGNQSVKPDLIYVNVPYTNHRTGEPYVIPEFLTNWEGVVVQRSSEDYGPLTKLVPTLRAETDPNTIIITVDDDRVYMRDTVKYLTWFAELEPSIVWGLSGYGIMWYPLPKGMVQVSVPWVLRGGGGRAIDILMAVKGIAYRRKFFHHIDDLANIHPDCFLADDTWIAGYLATVERIPRMVPPGPLLGNFVLESRPTNWYKRNHVNRLRQHTAPDKEYNCILAVESRFGPWRELTARKVHDSTQ